MGIINTITNINRYFYRGNSKTHLPVKITLLRPFAPILLTQPSLVRLGGWPRRMARGSLAATRKRPQNHRFFQAKQFCYCLFIVVILGGCYASPAWHVTHQTGSQKEFDSARLSYPIRDKVNEVAVEMIYTKNSLRTYLAVLSHLIPPHQGNEKEARVVIRTPSEQITGVAHRHAGGQRVTLPESLQQTVIDHLLEGNPVTIELVGYSTTLKPTDFKTFYQKLNQAPVKLPIQIGLS